MDLVRGFKAKNRLIFQGSWHPGRDHLNEPIGFHLNSDVLKARDTIFMETTLFQAPEKKPYLQSLNDDKLEPLMPTFRQKLFDVLGRCCGTVGVNHEVPHHILRP